MDAKRKKKNEKKKININNNKKDLNSDWSRWIENMCDGKKKNAHTHFTKEENKTIKVNKNPYTIYYLRYVHCT